MNSLCRRVLMGLIMSCTIAPCTTPTVAADRQAKQLTVFAAASLTEALRQVAAQYTKSSGIPVRLSFAASSALARQIEAGARADVFFSADRDWMNYLDRRALIDRGSRQDLLGNRLALIAPRDSKVIVELESGAPLVAALGPNGRLSVGDPDSVPVGKYAKAALTALHLWDALRSRLVPAENVRVALMYVARGEAPLGIVYATDVVVEPKVRIVDLFPETSHEPIRYPVAAVTGAAPEATSFIAFLRSDAARSVFVKAGFTIVSRPPAVETRAGEIESAPH